MLVVTSNWCVSDGTLAAGAPRAWTERFRAEVRRASLRYGVRHDGRYRPLDAIDIVLAGDTFDWLVSREWTGDLRPWHVGRRADAARERVASGAVRRGERFIATLAGWMRRGIGVPTADRRGRPMPTRSRCVPVRVTLLRGDRDRWLEEGAHARTRPGPDRPAVGRCWSDGKVTIRHGDEMDPLHAASGCDTTIGESLAVDLIARFGVEVHDIAAVRPLAGGVVRRLAGGAPVDASRKLTRWIDALREEATISESVGTRLLDAWRRSVDLWHRSAWRLSLHGANGVDMVDRIAEWLRAQAAPSAGETDRWIDPFPAPPMAFLWDATPSVVLGHGALGAVDPPVGRRRAVCLSEGDSPSGKKGDDDPRAPALVVIQPHRAGLRFEWLSIEPNAGDGDQRDGDQRDGDQPGHGVWQSAPSWRGGIVDAA